MNLCDSITVINVLNTVVLQSVIRMHYKVLAILALIITLFSNEMVASALSGEDIPMEIPLETDSEQQEEGKEESKIRQRNELGNCSHKTVSIHHNFILTDSESDDYSSNTTPPPELVVF